MQVGIFIPPEDHPDHDPDLQEYLEQLVTTCCAVQSKVQFVHFQIGDSAAPISGCKQILLNPKGMGGILRRDSFGLNRALKETPVEVLVAPLAPQLSVNTPLFLCALDLAAWEQAPNDDPAPLRPQNVKRWKQYCLQARRILAPTKYVQRRFLDFFECPMDKLLISPVGLSETPEDTAPPLAETPYIVVYASTRTRSLMHRVRSALEVITEKYPHQVIVLGPGYPDEPHHWGANTLRLEHCPADLRASLCRHGDIFIYAGLHDGSAMRLLEAIRAGIPVVAAKSGALEEVVGDLPVYFNPGSTNAIIRALQRVLDEPEAQQEKLDAKAAKVLGQHNWETCAWKFLGALKQLS